jgi:hypothetical protein
MRKVDFPQDGEINQLKNDLQQLGNSEQGRNYGCKNNRFKSIKQLATLCLCPS